MAGIKSSFKTVTRRLGCNLPKEQQAFEEPLNTASPLSLAGSARRSTGRPANCVEFQARPGVANVDHGVSSLFRAAGAIITNDELPRTRDEFLAILEVSRDSGIVTWIARAVGLPDVAKRVPPYTDRPAEDDL